MAVPYIFAASTSAIPLANLDSNFAYFANAITVSSGNVGIGTNSPSSKLDVVDSNVVVKSNASSGYGSFYANGATGGQSHYFFGINSTETARISSDAGNYLVFSTGSAASERMRINSSGNVGIGTSSPAAKLDIISGTARMYFSNQSATAFFTAVNTSNSAYAPMAINGSELILKTGDAERMRIASSGNVGIGTTGPNETLHVQGTFRATGNVSLYSTGSVLRAINFGSNEIAWAQATTNTFLNICDASGNNGANYNLTIRGLASAGTVAATLAFVTIDTSNLNCLGVYTSTVGATNRDVFVDNTGKIGYVSSLRRTKTNIENLTDTSWLHQLNPVTFNYRKKDEEGSYTDEVDGDIQYGLIAEDVEQVRPDLCFYDEVDGEQELRGIQYSKLVPVMLKAIQELKAENDALKSRLDAAGL